MKKSAGYFNYRYNEDLIKTQLDNIEKKIGLKGHLRVRLMLLENGSIKIDLKQIVPAVRKKIRIGACGSKTDSRNILLLHKTTDRNIYDKELASARKKGFFDAVFFNEKGELTEGCISNIYIRIKKRLYTPPVSSGVLPGIIRGVMMKKFNIREKPIGLEELKKADGVYISNSIIGFRKAVLEI